MKHITTEELKRMTGTEGLILQGCGGDTEEWVSGINELLTAEGILLGGDTFKDVYSFEHDGLTNLLFSMEDVRLDVGKLAIWRIATHGNFGGTWLSDYLPNRLGVNTDERENTAASPLQVYIENAHNEQLGGFTMELPATREVLQPFLDGLEITDATAIAVKDITSSIDGLSRAVFACADEGLRLDELNYLAAKIGGLSPDEHEVFAAVCLAEWHCGSIAEIINITENLGNFELQPAFNAAQYGDFLIEMAQDEHAALFKRLENSDDPKENAFAAYVERLEASVDSDVYGRYAIREEKGVLTNAGYITEEKGFQEIYRGAQDIPAEYRVFAYPEAEPKAHAENINLTALVLQMHALSRSFTANVSGNLHKLADGNTDYLLVLTAEELFHLTNFHDPQIDKYTAPGTQAFVFHVTHRENGCAFGEVIAVDFAERHHDLANLLQSGSAVVVADFLSDLNRGYMRDATNPQPDMLRVTRVAASQMLARGDADVFRLLPIGSEKLSPIDAVRCGGLWYSENREFAIRREDLPGLNKWARRAAGEILRQTERGEHKKSYEPEV
jgi:hypothetical protein